MSDSVQVSGCSCAWFTKRRELGIPLAYDSKSQTWALRVIDHDGRKSLLVINFCPSCGGKADWTPPPTEAQVIKLR